MIVKTAISLSKESADALQAMASADNRSVSNMVDTLVKQEIARRATFGVRSITDLPAPENGATVPVITVA